MKTVEKLEQLGGIIDEQEAVLVLFGGRECNVCHAIKPKLEEAIAEQFPKMERVYVDCHATAEVCAQVGVLSLPTLQVFLEGQCILEAVRTFSLQKVVEDIKRPYELVFE